MNAWIGWGLAVIGVALGHALWGWPGVGLALSVVVFWLLLQFSRAMRAMRVAAQGPVGRVDSAVMLQAKLKAGMRLMDILVLTRSLGRIVEPAPGADASASPAREVFEWADASNARVLVTLQAGRVQGWQLERDA